MANTMLKISKLKKSFGDHEVLKGISFDMEKSQVISVIGPSGSGKTTMLRCINFLEKADSGLMSFDDRDYDLAQITKKEILELRQKTGFVFQNFNLFRNMNVLRNVTEGLTVVRKVKKAEAEEKAKVLLEKVGMADHMDRYPYQLSGGQQQRVAIARALATDPEIMYFDEPTSALDPELIGEVEKVIKQLADEGMTMIVVTHELNFAKKIADKVIFMDHGTIIESNNSKDFFENPQMERTKEFLRSTYQ